MSVDHQVHRALQQMARRWVVPASSMAKGDLKMTEAELWHMHLLAVENASVGLQGVMTIIFAYLATAHFVGKNLTRFQAVLASFFFVIAAGVSSFMALVEFRRAAFFMVQLGGRFGVASISPNNFVIPLFAVLMALLIPASVYFMYQVRKRPARAAGPE